MCIRDRSIMAKIASCEVLECSYNRGDGGCHTMAITVGDTSCPMCDTYTRKTERAGDLGVYGGVGACRADDCRYNESLECKADFISVGKHSGHADCKTYTPK
jgi:hypothetical protein